MWKIDYSKVQNYENEYLKYLELAESNTNGSENNKTIKQKLEDKNNEWGNIKKEIISLRKQCGLDEKLPKQYEKDFKQILLADFEELLRIYVDFENLQDKCKQKNIIIKKENDTDNEELFERIEKCFDYDSYSSLIAKFFIKYQKELRIASCFYCDTGYINIIPGTKNNNGIEYRLFETDHIIAKKQCPILALSLKNFVPSCKICNSSTIKGQTNFLELYKIEKPIDEEKIKLLAKLSPSSSLYNYDSNVKISVLPEKKEGIDWFPTNDFYHNPDFYRIKFIHYDEDYRKATEAFKLEERYNYGEHLAEALNLLDLQKRYTKSNIQYIAKILNKSGRNTIITEEQIYEDIFHKSLNHDTGRIFAKLKKDILE